MVGRYCIVRATGAGVHAGIVVSTTGDMVELENARRLWHWTGAATLSELAVKGTKTPATCKWPAAVPRILIRDWCEIIPVSEEAMVTFAQVPIWTA